MKSRRPKIRIAIHKKSALCLFLLISIVTLPLSMAQACQTSEAAETPCCRAMRFACLSSETSNTCCLRGAPVPAPGIIPVPVKRASTRAPGFTVAFLWPAAFSALPRVTDLRLRTPLGGESPPGVTRIFLLNSALLI